MSVEPTEVNGRVISWKLHRKSAPCVIMASQPLLNPYSLRGVPLGGGLG